MMATVAIVVLCAGAALACWLLWRRRIPVWAWVPPEGPDPYPPAGRRGRRRRGGAGGAGTGTFPVAGNAGTVDAAAVGDDGGPAGGMVGAGLSGYLGGAPPPRWEALEVSLEDLAAFGLAESTGKIALSHPTTAVQLSFIGGQRTLGKMGWNWSHDWDLVLMKQVGTTPVDVRHEGGRWDRYEYSGGTWVPEPGRRTTLVQNGDSSWTETTPYGVECNFPATGSGPPQTVRATSVVYPNGNRVTLSYSGSNLTSVLDAFGQRITFSYDGSNRVSAVQDPEGRRTSFSYDAYSHLESVLHPDGSRVTYAYSAHDVIGVTDPSGRINTFAYDGDAKLYTVTDPADRKVRTITYDVANSRSKVVDARGRTWTNSYSSNANPAQRDDPLGRSRQNSWTADMDFSATSMPGGSAGPIPSTIPIA
jgi:YD repeat-containing protein